MEPMSLSAPSPKLTQKNMKNRVRLHFPCETGNLINEVSRVVTPHMEIVQRRTMSAAEDAPMRVRLALGDVRLTRGKLMETTH